ncbi:MAG: OsmC family protein [Candidatus Berkiella sp.]
MTVYSATIEWKRQTQTFDYKTYNREHHWRFANGMSIDASAAPEYLGKESCLDPEESFVATLSSCHMLFFLAIASMKGFTIDSYIDKAVGTLEKNANGKLAMTKVVLKPQITFTGDKKPSVEDINHMHEKAHKECFIANSVNTEISIEL